MISTDYSHNNGDDNDHDKGANLTLMISSIVATCWVYRGGLPGILTRGVGWGGVGWGGVGWGGVGWGGVCQRWCSCVHMVRCWCVDVYTWYVGWGGVGWRGVGCVNVGVHVYTWYAAGVLMCTHGTLLVC